MRRLALIVIGCALAGCGGTRANVVDPKTDLHLSGNWNDADSRAVAETVIPQCVGGAWIGRFRDEHGRPPVIRVGHVAVRVQDLDDAIEPGIITDDLVRALLATGQVRAVASREEASLGEGARDVRREMAVQAAAAPADRQETAADYLLNGVIVSQDDDVREKGVAADTFRRVKFYQVTLTLTDLTTNEVAWSGQAERKKTIDQSSISF